MPTLRPAWRRVAQVLWMATTPIALTLLLASPAASAPPHVGGAPGAGAPGPLVRQGEEHHLVTNPIENFLDINYKGRDTHGGVYEPEEGDHKMPPPFLGALTNFLVYAFLIGKFAGPGLGRYVRERHDRIASQLDEAARLRDEARAKLDEYAARVDALQGEIATLTASLRQEAEAEKARILANAEERAARLRRDAEQQIQAELARVRAELEREVVVKAVELAEAILRERATDADHRALADKFVKQMERAPALVQPGRSS